MKQFVKNEAKFDTSTILFKKKIHENGDEQKIITIYDVIGDKHRLFTYEDILNIILSIGEDVDSNESFNTLQKPRQREIIDELKTEINKHI